MGKERIDTGKSPFVRVESIGGDLAVRGWAETYLENKGEYELEETEKGPRLTSKGDLRVNVPAGASLTIGDVRGDLAVKLVEGNVSVEQVHGDAALASVGEAQVGTINGDFAARNLTGVLTITEVYGDVAIRRIGSAVITTVNGDIAAHQVVGDLTIDTLNGDADFRKIDGDVKVSKSLRDVNLSGVAGQVVLSDVAGDIRLRGGLESGDHSLEAQGDIVIRWPAGVPLNLVASGRRIDNRLPLEDVTEKNGSLIGRIGAGKTNLTVTAGGRVILKEAEPANEKWENYQGDMEFEFGLDMAGIAARIETEVNNHLSRVTRDFETKFGPDFGQRIAEKFSRHAEKTADRARRRTESRGRAGGFDYTQSTPAPAKKAASTEEQLKILKMVETGKISPEEAGMLLEALDA